MTLLEIHNTQIIADFQVSKRLLALILVALLVPALAKPSVLRSFKNHGDTSQYLVYSPNGKYLASWTSSEIQLWDPGTGKKTGQLKTNDDKRSFLAFARDSKRIFTVFNGKLEGWGVPSLKKAPATNDGSLIQDRKTWVSALTGFGYTNVGFPYHSVYSHAGHFVASSGAQRIDVRAFPDVKKILWSGPETGRDVTTVTVTPDGKRMAYGTMGASLFLTDVATKKYQRLVADGEIRSIACTSKLVAVGCADLSSHIYVVTWAGDLVAQLDPPGGDTWALAFSPDGKFLASGHELDNVNIWKL